MTELRKNYNKALEGYTKELKRMWDISDDYWVLDEPGGLYCFNDCSALTAEELVYVVDNNVQQKDYDEWIDYCLTCHDLGLGENINLRSWIQGAPRISQASLDKLQGMKRDLEREIEKVKDNLG